MQKKQERQLVKKCINQDRLAQRMLYEQYKSAMFSCAFRITNDFDLAHDALQEAFINVFNGLKNFKGTGTLGSWIKIIVIRAALKEVRGLHMHIEIGDQQIEAAVGFDDTLTGELLHELMLGLPDKCRVVFNLIEVEGYPHKEVAELMGVTVGTTKSQLHYAKRMLQKKLVKRGYEQRKRG